MPFVLEASDLQTPFDGPSDSGSAKYNESLILAIEIHGIGNATKEILVHCTAIKQVYTQSIHIN